MFTGIITHIGHVARIDKKGDWTIHIATDATFLKGVKLGASIACSGVCLTVIAATKKEFVVQTSKETLRCTTLSDWKKGSRVNLERALKVGDELGGHIVSGHVDGVARLISKEKAGDSEVLWFSTLSALSAFIAAKGSVTLDGVSLTVNQVKGNLFSVNIIPHTLFATTLGGAHAKDRLNLEVDVLARYIQRSIKK